MNYNGPSTIRVLCLIVCLLLTGALPAADRKPNIIFIMVDDLGYGDLGCYGQKEVQTPNIDRLAADGRKFTQFYAGSTVCAPSRCVLMTGLHTGRCFIRGNGKDNLRPEDITVAEVLRSAGYATALVGKWGLGHEGSEGVPTRQGFDFFFGYLDQHHAHNYYPQFLMRNEERVLLPNVVPNPGKYGQGVATEKRVYSHDLTTVEALSFVRRSKERPFFLYLAWTIPHANNEAGDKGMEVPDYGIYIDRDWPDTAKGQAAMITRMDTDVGHLRALLEEQGVAEDTIIFFTSDNGPHNEGGHSAKFFDSNGPLRGTKRDLTEGGIRVPMIVHWPGKVEAGSESDFIGGFWDVLPTLADLAGVGAHVPAGLDGISFVPAILGQTDRQRQHEYLYWAFYERGGAQAVRTGPWKAVIQPMGTPLRLYNLDQDLGESHDVAGEHPRLVSKMKATMAEAYEPSERWKFPERRRRGRR